MRRKVRGALNDSEFPDRKTVVKDNAHMNSAGGFTVASVGSCIVIALLARCVQKGKSLEKVTHRVNPVTVD